jgi:NADH:ubiquinone reductase (H+-translocating)
MSIRKKIIIIGAGFAGLQLIEHLDSKLFEILLIDKLNHHQFQPLFYQVATSQIEPSSVSFPLRKIFQKKRNLQIRMETVQEIFHKVNQIRTDVGVYAYDHLIIATGCKTNFFGNAELERNCYKLKTTYDAIKIRNALLLNFEKWISEKSTAKDFLFNLIIVGGGPTGVELAGSLVEIKNKILPKDFPGLDLNKLNIILLEGSNDTLNAMSKFARISSKKYLLDLGVMVKTGILVTAYDGVTATLNNQETIKSPLVIWAAGVTGNIIQGIPESAVDTRSRRYLVNRFNQVEGCADIYAVGDIALMKTPKFPFGHPQLANVAINQAKNLAKNLAAPIKKKKLKEFEYRNLGTMATIGKHKAIVDLPFWKFKGRLAWFVWMFLHLMLILSVRNKLIVFIHWSWNYFSNDTSLRLILRDYNQAKNSNLKGSERKTEPNQASIVARVK